MQAFSQKLLRLVICLATLGLASVSFAQGKDEKQKPEEKKAKKEKVVFPEEGPDPNAPLPLHEALLKKKKELDAREAELEQARKDLLRAERELNRKIDLLNKAVEEKRRAEKGILSAKELKQKEKIEHLMTVTSKMEPPAAAVYLDGLDPRLAASILHTMKERKAAAITSQLPASKAALLSRIYMKSERAKSTNKPTNQRPK